MNKETKRPPKIADIAGRVFALLEPLISEDRRRVINGALTLLGEPQLNGVSDATNTGAGGRSAGEGGAVDHDLAALPTKAKTWMKQNGLRLDEVEQVFDISGEGVSVIASSAPGKNNKEKTHNGYVLQGLSRLLASGEANFDDKDARKVCEELGCYDKKNHSTYIGDKGNLLAGSKSTGWKVTAPGLKHGAGLVKQLTKED